MFLYFPYFIKSSRVRSPYLTNKTLVIMLRAFFLPCKPDIENKLIRIIFERIELYAGALLALKNYLGRSSCQCMVKDKQKSATATTSIL